MPNLSVRPVVANCLGKSGSLSLLEDVFGVYGDNTQTRSLKTQLDLIQNRPFVRVALVTIQGATPNLQRDLDNANIVYQYECGCWIYCVGSITVDLPHLLVLAQNDCWLTGHCVSDEENELFYLGRDMGASIVCYYIQDCNLPYAGCAAHPPGRPGFWVEDGANEWVFAHELTHVVGDNGHVSDSDNLMWDEWLGNVTNPPPDLTDDQCNRIRNDPNTETCE